MAIDTWAERTRLANEQATTGRHVRVGRSGEVDTHRAVSEAVRSALAGPDTRAMFVFTSSGASADKVAAAVVEQTTAAGLADLPVLGCSTAGHLGSGGSGTDPDAGRPEPDIGATAVAIGGDIDIATAIEGDLHRRPRDAGRALAAKLQPPRHRDHHLAILLTDVVAGDHPEMVRGAYSEWGATMPIAGGVAGPLNTPFWQLYGGEVHTDCVTGMLLSSDAPMTVAVHHGWRGDGSGMLATASNGNVLYELDDRPALDAFVDRLHVPDDICRDAEEFNAYVLSRPLAISRRGRLALRQIVSADHDERTLICSAVVPRGAQVFVAQTDAAATIAAADRVCAEAVAGLHGQPLAGLLVFDCIGRRMALPAESLATEWATMRTHTGGAPIGGFYTGGEFARVHGAVGFHNQSIVACALG
jgi:hypothetical protein